MPRRMDEADVTRPVGRGAQREGEREMDEAWSMIGPWM